MLEKICLCFTCPAMMARRDAFLLEGFDQLGQFAQREPMDCRRAVGFNFRRGFFLDGGDNDVEALGARGVQHQEGKASVARDEAERVGSWSEQCAELTRNCITKSAVLLAYDSHGIAQSLNRRLSASLNASWLT